MSLNWVKHNISSHLNEWTGNGAPLSFSGKWPFYLCSYIHIDQDWLPRTFNLRNYTLQIECFGENDFEDLLHIY